MNASAEIDTETQPRSTKDEISDILSEMDRLRFESLSNHIVLKSEKDQYLQFVSRLATTLDSLEDGEIRDLLGKLAKFTGKHEDLLVYDPNQDGFWRKRYSGFVENTDSLLIRVVGDRFSRVETKHHLVQATKYFTVEGRGWSVKNPVYDSITPFNAAVPLDFNEGLFPGILAGLFGEFPDVSHEDDFTLKVKGILSAKKFPFEKMIDFAKGRGYRELKFRVKSLELPALRKKFASITSEGQSEVRGFSSYYYVDDVGVVVRELPKPSFDLLPVYENIASFDVPEIVEQNLRWGHDNHNNFGNQFSEYIRENQTFELPKGVMLESEIDRERHLVLYEHTIGDGDFRKDSFLVCGPGYRYIVTALMNDPLEDNYNNPILDVLTSNISDERKLHELVHETEAKCLRLRRFEKSRCVFDLEGFV
jgi:hypothetical protein